MTTWLYAYTRLAWASGRAVVEYKMVTRLRDQKLQEKSVMPENVAEVDLPDDKKSKAWQRAMLAYQLAAPLVIASPI